MSQTQFTRAALPELTPQERAVNRVAEATHRLNEAVRRATEEGYSIELIRVSRIHDGNGNWGDQVVPSVREKRAGAEAAS